MGKLLVHLHIFYPDQIPYFLDKLANIHGCEWDLAVTCQVLDPEERDTILKFKPDAIFIPVGNHGYDIWPFIKVLREVPIDQYEFVLKLHTKARRKDAAKLNGIYLKGYKWRNLMVDAIMASPEQFATVLKMFTEDPSLGIVYNSVVNRKLCPNLLEDGEPLRKEMERIGVNTDWEYFCAGTMFLARMSPYRVLRDADIDEKAFGEQSATASTGSLAHIYERILTLVVPAAGLKVLPLVLDRVADAYIRATHGYQLYKFIFNLDREGPDLAKYLTIFGIRIKVDKGKKF